MPVSEVWHQRLAAARDERERQQRWRNRRVSAHGALDFAGNDYLGLAQDPRVQAAQAEGAKRFEEAARRDHEQAAWRDHEESAWRCKLLVLADLSSTPISFISIVTAASHLSGASDEQSV